MVHEIAARVRVVHEMGAREYIAVHELLQEITELCTSTEWCTRTSGAQVGVLDEIGAQGRVVHEMVAREYVAVHE